MAKASKENGRLRVEGEGIDRDDSIDWFKGKITGKSHSLWESLWFPVDFPLSQPIKWSKDGKVLGSFHPEEWLSSLLLDGEGIDRIYVSVTPKKIEV